ncbi:MAG: hypothetical protein HY246_08865 [Proteobacteria bacterium]|nr:hypothetical protein [Pseudomonadota bacterium]
MLRARARRDGSRAIRIALLALLVVAGIATVAAPGSSAAAAETVAVTVTLVDVKPGPPPLNRLLVDVRLENDRPAPVWTLIPSFVPSRGGGGVDNLEQITATSGAVVGRFLGRAGTYALKLAPGARVTLRRLEIGWWRDKPDAQAEAMFDVRLADDLTIDGRPAAAWFTVDPIIAGLVDVDMTAAVHANVHRSPGNREVPLPGNREVPLAPIAVTPVAIRLAVP